MTNEVIVPFSGGKDSLAVLELLHQNEFTIRPYFMYIVKGIGFQQRYLAMIERRYGFEILQVPHPQLFQDLKWGYYRTPVPDMPKIQWNEIDAFVRSKLGLNLIICGGEKKMDSLQRRGMISSTAPDGYCSVRNRGYVISEWSDHDVYSFINKANIPLPPDYAMFRGSWGGDVLPRKTLQIYRRYPEDYEKLKKVYPFIEAAVLKAEMEEKNQPA